MQPQGTDLQISEDMEFQRRSWRVERVSWVVMAAVLAAALVGLFGRGLAGPTTAASADGRLAVEYWRFWRAESPMVLRVHLDSGDKLVPEARVWIARSYLEACRLAEVVPRPERVEAGDERVTFVFARTPTDRRTAVTFDFEPQQPWRLRGQVGLDGGAAVEFAQFIYP